MSLQQINKHKPLVLCMTNYVVANFTANGLLAIGASPIMTDAIEEIAEMTRLVNGVLINIGTLNARTVESMSIAVAEANKNNIPVVLDPVGAGATSYRLQTALNLLKNHRITLLRCNAGELAAIAGVKWQANGVDSGRGEANIEQLAIDIANQYSCIVIVTGENDVITDGRRFECVNGGHENITKITGTGCLLSAICAALLASYESIDDLTALLKDYKLAAEKAFTQVGTYQIEFLNELERLAEVEV